MAGSGTPAGRQRTAWPLIVTLLGLGVLGAAAAFALRAAHRSAEGEIAPLAMAPSPSAAKPAARPVPSVQPAAPGAPAPRGAPVFDIVRIAPTGDAVMAGRATPGADVMVLADGKPLGRVTAGADGTWALVSAVPLPPGGHELTLAERVPGGADIPSAGAVVAVVPGAAAAAGAPPLAVLAQPDAPSRVLQAPEPRAAVQPGGDNLGLATVDYDEHGTLRFAGVAPPGRTIRVYLDDRVVGDAAADPRGRWTLAPTEAVALGRHVLRVDQIDPRGAVTARIEVPFQREQLTAAKLGDSRVVVMPGESLWRLARLGYGTGLRYTVIYEANQAQIRDPNKIYPGQAFTMPAR